MFKFTLSSARSPRSSSSPPHPSPFFPIYKRTMETVQSFAEASGEADQFTTGGVVGGVVPPLSFFANASAPRSCLYILLAIIFVESIVGLYDFFANYTDRNRLQQVKEQMSILKFRTEQLQGIDNFAARSKVERTINKLDVERKRLSAVVETKFTDVITGGNEDGTPSLRSFLLKKGWEYASQPLLVTVILFMFWGEHLYVFPSGWFFPIDSSYLGSALGWTTVCYRAIRKITNAIGVM